MNLTLKKGKLPYVPDQRDHALEKSGLDLSAVSVPSGDFGNYPLLFGKTEPDESMFYDFSFPLGMYGNDKVGDCVPCAAAHAETLESLEGDHQAVAFTEDDVVGDYSAVTGYKPGHASTDRGTEVRAYLNYQRKTGIQAQGGRKRIGLFGDFKFNSVEELLAVVAALGKARIGFYCTNRNMEQFNAKEPFQKSAREDEGHCVDILGVYDGKLVVFTWGTLALMEFDCYESENDEAWGYYSTEMLNGGKTVSGLDREKALAVVEGLS